MPTFESFMKERRRSLLALIGNATGHIVDEVVDRPEEGEELSEDVARDSDISITGT
jgi:hypothetical protein